MQYALVDHDVELELKAFDPSRLPALIYMSQQNVEKRDFKEIQQAVDPFWSDITGSVMDFVPGFKTKLYLNFSNPIIKKLLTLKGEDDQVHHMCK